LNLAVFVSYSSLPRPEGLPLVREAAAALGAGLEAVIVAEVDDLPRPNARLERALPTFVGLPRIATPGKRSRWLQSNARGETTMADTGTGDTVREEGAPDRALPRVGDTASFAKTVTEADVVLYAGLTGDFNPVHIDRLAAASSLFGERVAHGLLTAGLISTVLGTRLPGAGTVYLEQHLRFVAPVRIGDTITAWAEVMEIDEPKRRVRLRTWCANQAGRVVIEGEALCLVPASQRAPRPGLAVEGPSA